MDGSPQAVLFTTLTLPRVGLVPVTEDAATLYETWVGWGGEGIVLKEPTSIYRPGIRSPAWLKVKPKVTLEIVVTGGSSEPIQWGDWGLAVMLEIAYKNLQDGKPIQIRQAVRIRRDEPFTLRQGEQAELICWGVMPSGMLRHPLFMRWVV
jgi:ATP-dependent DNA ligase